jgi:hypothetical protein
METAGTLGDSHALSQRARTYANEVVFGDEWPLTPDHVYLSRVTFETSTRMKRQHGVCSSEDAATARFASRGRGVLPSEAVIFACVSDTASEPVLWPPESVTAAQL